MSGPDVTGMDEYAEKAARDAAHLTIRERESLLYAMAEDELTDHPVFAHVERIVAARVAEARAEERERIALDLHERAQSVTWWLSHTGLARKDAFETAARIARGEAT